MAMMPTLMRALQLAKAVCLIGVMILWSVLILETTQRISHPHHGLFTSNMAYGFGYTLFDPFRLMMFPLFLWRCKQEFLDRQFRRHPRSLRRDRVRMRMTLGAHTRLGYLILLNKYPEIYKGQTPIPRPTPPSSTKCIPCYMDNNCKRKRS